MAIEIVDFPINSMVDLSIATLNYQRVDSWSFFGGRASTDIYYSSYDETNLYGYECTVLGCVSNRQNQQQTKVVGSGLGIFKFVWKPSQPIGDFPPTDILFLQIAWK